MKLPHRREKDQTRTFQKMGEALGWKREDSAWANNFQTQPWPKNAVKENRSHDNSGINKHYEGDWNKDRNEVYNVGGGHVKEAYDKNEYKLNG